MRQRLGKIDPTLFADRPTCTSTTIHHTPLERLSGSVERVTFHSEKGGFCVLRVKVRGQRELVTVTGSAASVTPGEYVECRGNWINDAPMDSS